jgi:DNA-directed RNA polymerase specialized sigma24 family protein
MNSDMWPGHQMIDPTELEARFSTEDGMAYMDSIFACPSEESTRQIDRVRSVLDLLPPREADFVSLYYFSKLRQTAIANIFGVSQPTVCYRLQRAAERIRFLLDLPDVGSSDVEDAARQFLTSEMDIKIMVFMFETTCQSEVAKRLGVSQGMVRHRFIRSLNKMREVEGLEEYVALFQAISENLNILREVCRSSNETAVTHVID